MASKLLPLFAAIALLAGCSTVTIDVTEAGGENRISSADAVPIAIDRGSVAQPFPFLSGARRRLEKGAVWDTSKVWPRVFTGRVGRDPVFRVDFARMVATLDGGGFTNRYTFEVDGTLLHDGRVHIVHASGSRAAAMQTGSAARQAVELAVVNAAKRCREIIEQAPSRSQRATGQ